jgi:pyruvate formate lyase activating enzyme
MDGWVFDIQRFSIHDGPGIRTTVFLQGCNLRCSWCHNPESQAVGPSVQFFPDKCILCARCVEACPQGAQLVAEGRRVYVRDLCRACGACVDTCFAAALVIKARRMSVAEVMAEVEKDRPYYDDSAGGVTFSGGEPALQDEFLLHLLRESKQRGFHTAVDTACHAPWEAIAALLPHTDLFLVDVKAFDEATHRAGAGVSNRRILENVRRLAASGVKLRIRVPVVPGFNADAAELSKIADFLAGLERTPPVELLPFHHLGGGKYESLGREYPSRALQPPSDEAMAGFLQLFLERGLDATRAT